MRPVLLLSVIAIVAVEVVVDVDRGEKRRCCDGTNR